MLLSKLRILRSLKKLKQIKIDIESITFIFIDSFILITPVLEVDIFDVCVVKVDALGDFFLSLDSFYNIALKNKGKRSILICNHLYYELAKKINLFDQVYPIEINKFKTNYVYRFLQLRKLKKLKIDISLQPTFSRDILTGDSIIRGLNAKINFGHFGDCTNQSKFLKYFGNHWYSNLLKFKNINMHELEVNKKFLNFIGINQIKKYKIQELTKLNKINFDFKKNYIVITPGASDHNRAWPVNKYISLIKYLLLNSDYYIFLLGSKYDQKISNLITKKISNSKLLDYTGKTKITELVEIIRFSKFVLGNDSSSIHIAYSLEVKSICLSGGNNFKRFVPYSKLINYEYKPKIIFDLNCYQRNWKCCSPNKCINNISLDQVLNVVNKYL